MRILNRKGESLMRTAQCPTCKIALKTENRTYTMPSGDKIAKIEPVTGPVEVCPSCDQIYLPDQQTIDLGNIMSQIDAINV